jgi:hypothetical protein
MTKRHTDELDTARLGATADLVYLLDAARQHLEATEELAAARVALESPDLAARVQATGLALEQCSPEDLEMRQKEHGWTLADVAKARSRVTSLEIQATALRELHRKTLNDFMANRPGPAERRADELLAELRDSEA